MAKTKSKGNWASSLTKRMKGATSGAKFCTPVPEGVTEADIKDKVKGEFKVDKKGRFVCITLK